MSTAALVMVSAEGAKNAKISIHDGVVTVALVVASLQRAIQFLKRQNIDILRRTVWKMPVQAL